MESTLKNLEASIQDLRSTNQSLVNTFDGIQQFLNIDNMQPSTTGKASKGNQYSWDVQQIMKGLEKLKGEKDSLIRSNLKLEKEKEQVEIELQRLQTLVGNLGTSFNDENTPKCVDSKGSGKSEDVVSNLGKQIKTLKGEKTRLEQTLEQANIHCISLRQNMEKLKNVFADVLNDSKDSYTCNIQNLKLGLLNLSMMSEEMQHLVSKAEAIREHRNNTVNKLKDLEHQKNDMERRKTSENEDLRKQQEAIVNKLETIENEKKEVENRKISETERISQLMKQRDELEREKFTVVASLTKQRDDLLDKLKVMETEKADVFLKLKTLENEKSKAESVSFKVRDELKKHLASVLCSLYEHYKELKEDAREALLIQGIDKLKDEVISLRNESSKTLPSALAKLVHLIDIVEENTREGFISAKTGRYENARQTIPKGIEMLGIGAQPEGEMIEKIGFIQDRIIRLHKFVGEELQMLARVIKEAEDFKQAQPGVCEMLKKEIIRLGGYDLDNHDEKSRRMAAARRVISCLSGLPSKTVQVDPNANPLKQLATFQVEFLVNTKVYRRLEVDGDLGGVYQGAIHYFKINAQDGDISFANATMPGSQSSNMFVELLFLPANAAEVYETKSGDILGVGVKVKSGNEKDLREVVYNTCVINTDEVMEAVKGQPIDNFSLWPDLVSSWRWERNARGGWALMCIRWRFLLKNIFPELSDPLQVLAITGAKSSLDRSQTIKTISRR